TADANRAVEDGRIAAELTLPQAMADDRDRRPVLPELLGCETSPEHRLHADHGKRIVEYKRGEHPLRDVTAGDIAVAEIEPRGLRERSIRLDVRVLSWRKHLDVTRLRRQL